ncbi:hypothetical protein [Methanopyrus sp.]
MPWLRTLCPDNFATYDVRWAEEHADLLVVETTGLCLRCSPYVDASALPTSP